MIFSAGDAISVRLYLANSEKIIGSMRGRFTDADVADVARLAMAGLIQQTADVA